VATAEVIIGADLLKMFGDWGFTPEPPTELGLRLPLQTSTFGKGRSVNGKGSERKKGRRIENFREREREGQFPQDCI
jgi:hypothetical protein